MCLIVVTKPPDGAGDLVGKYNVVFYDVINLFIYNKAYVKKRVAAIDYRNSKKHMSRKVKHHRVSSSSFATASAIP